MGWDISENVGETSRAQLRHASGRFYSSPLNTTTDTQALSINTLYAIPFFVPETKTYTSINIEVTTLGVLANGRLGIYRDSDGAPGALVLDAGTISATTTGAKTIAISQSLTAGWYWLAYVIDVAHTVRSLPAASVLAWLGFTSGTDTVFHPGWSVAFTYAALPDPFTGGGALMTGEAPRVMLGV